MQTQISQLQTQIAGGGSAGQPLPSSTPKPADTITAEPTETAVPPTETAVPPTKTPVPTFTPRPPTATPIPCNQAKFVKDVTIPDGTTFTAGTSFTKTWRLQNTGSCTWTTGYDIVFVSGNSLGGPSSVEMPGSVAPGDVIDLSVDFKAPSSEGTYRSNWKLRDANGVIFGLGKVDATFYVDIKVSAVSSKYPLDFIASMCTATWTTADDTLPCPGTKDDSRGYVYRYDDPTLETGYVDDEPALVMFPEMITNGYIRGKYPSITVKSGYHFVTIIGCAHDYDKCDVTVQLDYQIGSGSITNLKKWHEVNDDSLTHIDFDLSSTGLVGKNVKFILTVKANGSYSEDRLLWLVPRIVKE
jgi:hypothetical protein